jgi:hypothetical protein
MRHDAVQFYSQSVTAECDVGREIRRYARIRGAVDVAPKTAQIRIFCGAGYFWRIRIGSGSGSRHRCGRGSAVAGSPAADRFTERIFGTRLCRLALSVLIHQFEAA